MYSFKSVMQDLPIADIDKKTRKVKAVWSKMGNIDLDGDIMAYSAFTKTIQEQGPKGKKSIWSLIDHKASLKSVIGKPEELYVEGDYLIAITPIIETELGEDILKLYEANLIQGHSVGFSTIKSTTDNNGIRTINEVKLYEGSAVLWPANPETPTLNIIKSLMNKEYSISERLNNLLKAFKSGSYTDETFSLIDIEIKQIQSIIESNNATPPAKAVEPADNSKLIEAIKSFNNTLKK